MEAYLTDDWKMNFEEEAGANGAKDGGHKKNSARIKSMDLITSLNKMNLHNLGRNRGEGMRRDIQSIVKNGSRQ